MEEDKLKGKIDVLETSKSDYTIERGRTQTYSDFFCCSEGQRMVGEAVQAIEVMMYLWWDFQVRLTPKFMLKKHFDYFSLQYIFVVIKQRKSSI